MIDISLLCNDRYNAESWLQQQYNSSQWSICSCKPLRLGVLACYLDPLDLGPFLHGSAVSRTLWLQLAQCMTKGFISDSGRVSPAFSNALRVPSFISRGDWWGVLQRVPLTAVLLVDTSRWEPQHQQHGCCTAGGLQWCADPLRGFPVGFPPIGAVAGTAGTTRTAPVFPSAGDQGIFLSPIMKWFNSGYPCKCENMFDAHQG